MTWEIAMVIVIEAAAVLFLVSKLWPRRPKVLQKPDVPASSLTRRKKDRDCH